MPCHGGILAVHMGFSLPPDKKKKTNYFGKKTPKTLDIPKKNEYNYLCCFERIFSFSFASF